MKDFVSKKESFGIRIIRDKSSKQVYMYMRSLFKKYFKGSKRVFGKI